ncbi:DUF7710 domain-containing protein [Plantactinospora sp. CA-294935]|uniref:DUF7710 domain-containing protein n=1 Tax=Plantactinospora sp. CA-294935 TaxID=3240012 RepID=UPI003D8D24F9
MSDNAKLMPGEERQPTLTQRSPERTTMWVFHGNHARYASGLFETLDAGLTWAAEHKLTGTMTEYRVGGTYDVAVEEGRFRPSRAHHGSPDHVAGFSPGLRHIHLADGHADD